jgi:hypothetical protein
VGVLPYLAVVINVALLLARAFRREIGGDAAALFSGLGATEPDVVFISLSFSFISPTPKQRWTSGSAGTRDSDWGVLALFYCQSEFRCTCSYLEDPADI